MAVLRTRLGAGEAAVIILAAEAGAGAFILNDRQARLEAQAQGFRVVGTAGVLLQAARHGLVDFPSSLEALLAAGLRLRPSERQRVLEGWSVERGAMGRP